MQNQLPVGDQANNMESSCANDIAYLFQEETGIVYNLVQSPFVVPIPKKAEYFSIILFEEGAGFVQIDDEIHEIEKGKVIVVFPGQVGACDLRAGTKAHQLIVQIAVYESISSVTTISLGQLKPLSGFDTSEELFSSLLYEVMEIKKMIEAQRKGYAEICISRLKTIYLILKGKCLESRDLKILDVNHPVILKFLDILDQSFKESRAVQYYAEKLHTPANYLNILCNLLLETSAKEVIKKKVITEVKNLILQSSYSIKEISYQFGFNDPSNFSSFFKKETGFLPRDFLKLRKNNGGNK
ncbi:MAG: AraC family transcriptional regulator [Sphingobacterium sp.]|jgi:AraC-like DNA-binding protein|nr:AraC family transcriptional regulator [Sphingobacterium sp.]